MNLVAQKGRANMNLLSHFVVSPLIPIFTKPQTTTISSPHLPLPNQSSHVACINHSLLTNLLSISIALTLNSPLPSFSIPSLNPQPPLLSPITPFSQSKNLQLGLENGKIRPCPSTNPGCVSTNPLSSSFAFPWQIPTNSTENAVQRLKEAILETQRNANIQTLEDTPYGKYLRAEIDGGFGRDVIEFLVNGDVVAYRCMATKVTYVYPFTTAFGDSKGQEERMKKIVAVLGWDAPSFESMD